jgi:hypothetical protein
MTNKHASKRHCLVGKLRPKAKDSKKRNKALARERKLALKLSREEK